MSLLATPKGAGLALLLVLVIAGFLLNLLGEHDELQPINATADTGAMYVGGVE